MKALILCGALTALAAPAIAGPATHDLRPVAGLHEVFEMTVPLGHLDLNRASGAKTALDGIKSAARKVCGERPHPMAVLAGQHHRACMTLAVDNAVAALDAPLVTARHGEAGTARLASR